MNPGPDPPTLAAPAQPGRPAREGRCAIVVVALLIAVGLAAWGVGIACRGYDYDEVQRAHSIWLAGQGLRPYDEFFECHPPYFILLSPIVGRCADPGATLWALRAFSAVGNLAFLAGLMAVGATCLDRGRIWAVAGVALVAAHPKVLDFLVEFRIDGWGYALAVWSIVRLRRSSGDVRRYVEFGVGTGLATGLFCPKLVLLPPLLVAFELATCPGGMRARLRGGASYVLGGGLSVGVFLLYLAIQGIGIDRTLQLLGRYHAQSNAHAAFHYGLMRQVAATPFLTGLIVAGVLAWFAATLRRRARPDGYLLALTVWLALQAALVAYPYKQYYAPWFLFGSAYVVVLGARLQALGKPLGVTALVVGCGLAGVDAAGIGRFWYAKGGAKPQRALIRLLNRVAAPGDRVVAVPPYHPIARRDVFFVWFNTTDPNGYDSEQIMAALPTLAPLVTLDRFRAELRAHPPAFVVLTAEGAPASYPKGQWRALSEFFPERGYRTVILWNVRLAVRPDRLDRLQ